MTCFQKTPLDVEPENNIGLINRKIVEIKKKIQLSEGQRKAYFEVDDNEARNNNEKINTLKKEVKSLTEQLSKVKSELGGEKQFRLIKYLHELGPLGNKNNDQLKQILDLKVIDLHKQLDIVRYKRRKKKEELDKMEMDYQKLAAERTKESGDSLKMDKSSKKTISRLENDIHRILVQWREAEHVRKKYSGIRYTLLNDSVKFESALSNVEKMIEQQNEEIKKLQDVNQSAMKMRDEAMQALLVQESKAAEAAAFRNAKLTKAKQRLSERHAELERLERRIFPTTGRQTMVQQDSAGSGDLPAVDEEAPVDNNMDDTFNKLMKTTGVSDPENVFEKFQLQKSTTERLKYLKNVTEDEKKRLESDQNLMIAELDAYKFAQVKDKEETVEEMGTLKQEIEKESQQKEIYEKDEKKYNYILLDIKKSFYECCFKLEGADESSIPDWSDTLSNLQEILDLLKKKYLAAVKLSEVTDVKEALDEFLTPQILETERETVKTKPTLEKTVSEERKTLPAAYQELLAPRTKSRNTGTPSGSQTKPVVSDEEEEIPSRGFLKRQAQIIIDTKSRRKGFKIPQMTGRK